MKKKYYLFLVEREIKLHYYYKSDLLSRFFKAYLTEPQRIDLQRQFCYITRCIKLNEWERFIENSRILPSIADCLYGNCARTFTPSFGVKQRWIEVDIESLYIPAILLFQTIEQFDSYCFIFELNGENYGWLTPLKKQALHS